MSIEATSNIFNLDMQYQWKFVERIKSSVLIYLKDLIEKELERRQVAEGEDIYEQDALTDWLDDLIPEWSIHKHVPDPDRSNAMGPELSADPVCMPWRYIADRIKDEFPEYSKRNIGYSTHKDQPPTIEQECVARGYVVTQRYVHNCPHGKKILRPGTLGVVVRGRGF